MITPESNINAKDLLRQLALDAKLGAFKERHKAPSECEK
jgi:hypothetical protein